MYKCKGLLSNRNHTALNGELFLTQSATEFQQGYHTDKRRTKSEIPARIFFKIKDHAFSSSAPQLFSFPKKTFDFNYLTIP